MRYQCDNCGQAFDDDEDVNGDSCNRCDDGYVYLISDDFEAFEHEVDAADGSELAAAKGY